MKDGKINIAIIGLGFGRDFVPLYLNHPNVMNVAICDTNTERMSEVAKEFGISWTHSDMDEVINNERYDAVHILTPVNTHRPITVKALKSGKHCASAVPMGLSIEEIEDIIRTVDETKLNFMMAETIVYGREYLYAKRLYDEGKLGKIQFLRGLHFQDVEYANPVWQGLPPMWYMTHAVAPLLDIMDTTAAEVHCYGSGSMRKEFTASYNNPFPIETAIFTLEGTSAKAEISRSLFETATLNDESFDIYGDKASFLNIGNVSRFVTISPLVETGKPRTIETVTPEIPLRPELLPKELAQFTKGSHGGSHPHLVHEFVSSIVEGRKPYINERRAANWSVPGICAHLSAMKNGEGIHIPKY